MERGKEGGEGRGGPAVPCEDTTGKLHTSPSPELHENLVDVMAGLENMCPINTW